MTDSDKIQTLPLPFLERMKEMLGNDYHAFLESYENPRTYGLRVNTAKLSCQDFQELSPFPIRPIPWINTWLVSDNVQVAPQEVEVSSYLVGQIDAEVDTDDLSNFQL